MDKEIIEEIVDQVFYGYSNISQLRNEFEYYVKKEIRYEQNKKSALQEIIYGINSKCAEILESDSSNAEPIKRKTEVYKIIMFISKDI